MRKKRVNKPDQMENQPRSLQRLDTKNHTWRKKNSKTSKEIATLHQTWMKAPRETNDTRSLTFHITIGTFCFWTIANNMKNCWCLNCKSQNFKKMIWVKSLRRTENEMWRKTMTMFNPKQIMLKIKAIDLSWCMSSMWESQKCGRNRFRLICLNTSKAIQIR